MEGVQSGKNVKYLDANVTVYNIDVNDDYIFVNTSLNAVTIYLPSIKGSGLDYNNKNFFISDSSGNANTNNITILAAVDSLNSGQPVAITNTYGSAECTIVNPNEWFVLTDSITGPSVTPTWQQTLIQSSALTQDNTVTGSGTWDFYLGTLASPLLNTNIYAAQSIYAQAGAGGTSSFLYLEDNAGFQLLANNGNDGWVFNNFSGLYGYTSGLITLDGTGVKFVHATASTLPVFDASKNLVSSAGTGFVKVTAGVISYDTAGYVPYTGATANVDLGAFSLTTPIIYGGTASGGNLTLQSTSNATKGSVIFPEAGTNGVKIQGLVGSTTNSAIYLNQVTPSLSNSALWGTSASTYLNVATSGEVGIKFGNTSLVTMYGTLTGGNITNFLVSLPSMTAVTTTANSPSFKVTGANKQWATGALATQYFNYFSANTVSFVGASTATNVYGIYVEASIAGTNATITNNYAAGFNGRVSQEGLGSSTFFGRGCGVADDLTTNLNTGFGTSALLTNITGTKNCAFGYFALRLATGSFNVAFGTEALQATTTGAQNVAIGNNALFSNQKGSGNTSVGDLNLFQATGSNNTGMGKNALYDLTSGTLNVAIGWNTGRGITTGSNNTIIGAQVTGLSSSLANNVIIADGAGNKVLWFNSSNALISSIKIDTATGINIATATNQLFAFWGATPIVQPTNTTAIDTLLVNTGLRASGGFANFATSVILRAGTASANTAPIKFTSGTNLTTPEAGALEYNGAGIYFTNQTYRRGLTQVNDVTISDTTVANTVTETTIFTGNLESAETSVSKVITARVIGIYSTVNASDTFTIRLKIGGTTVLTVVSTAKNVTNTPVDIELVSTIRSLGVTGTCMVYGSINADNLGKSAANTSTTVINTTTANTFTITIEWSAASASNTLTAQQGFLRVMN